MTRADSVMDRVKGSLFSRHNGDGTPRITEHELTRRLGVSRGSVREALVQLEKQGLIERRQRAGTSLRVPSIRELEELWEVRIALESLAGRLAAAQATDADLAELRAFIDQRVRTAAAGDYRAVDDADIEFHRRIIDLSGNAVIRDMIEGMHVFDRIFRIRYPVPSFWQADEDAAFGHDGIVEALAARDPVLAEQRVRCHVQGARNRRIEALKHEYKDPG